MHPKAYLPLSNVLAFLLLIPACGKTDNNVGTTPQSGGRAAGDSFGSGGVSGGGWLGPDCTGPDGKQYAVGTSYSDGCNTCTCQIVSPEPLTSMFRCTNFVCLDAGSGTGGTSGILGGGGISGAGGVSGGTGTGAGSCTDSDGKTYAVGESFKKDCNTCMCQFMGDTIGMVLTCTVMACPDASTDMSAGTDGPQGSEGATVPVELCLLTYNEGLVPDGADPCCYKTGGVNSCNTAAKCNESTGPGCCLIYGTENTSHGFRCCLYANGASVDGAEECRQLLAGLPVAVPSACPACGADELCVAYYDGTCKPMQSTCRKVTDTTRQAILVNHERCFAKPIGNEVCGGVDGGMFWGCGEPPCPDEPLVSDINCYGP